MWRIMAPRRVCSAFAHQFAPLVAQMLRATPTSSSRSLFSRRVRTGWVWRQIAAAVATKPLVSVSKATRAGEGAARTRMCTYVPRFDEHQRPPETRQTSRNFGVVFGKDALK